MKCIMLALTFFIASCSSNKNMAKKTPVNECAQGSVIACFEQGMKAREAKDLKKARDYFQKGCSLNHPFSCSEQGLMERLLGDMTNYQQLQERACESMDAIACYNLACAYCLKNDPTNTMEALNKASSLGYSHFQSAAEDPDLKCVSKTKLFQRWLAKVEKNKKSAFSISYDFSYLRGMDLSLRFPPSFAMTRSFPTLFVFHDKAQINVYLSPDSYQTCLEKLNKRVSEKEGVTDIQKLSFVRNEQAAHIHRFKFIADKKQLNEIIFMTGDDKRCWIVDGISDSKLSSELHNEIDMTVTSLVTKPFGQASDQEFALSMEPSGMKFAGISTAGQGTGFYTHYSSDGVWHPSIASTALYMGFFISTKLEEDPLFRQRLGDIALKLIPYGYEYSEFLESSAKLINGKLAIFYKSKAINKKTEVIVTSVFYQLSDSKLPVLLVHFQPKGEKEILDWESALKRIVLK